MRERTYDGSATPRATRTEGVYLLANDAVASWLSACAASLRSFNPDVRVVVLAYDDRIRLTRRICGAYGFELWDGDELQWLDAVAARLRGDLPAQRMLRKLAAFWGPLEHFVYLDADTVVLMDLGPVLGAIRDRRETFLFAHSDEIGGNLDEVYRPGPWRDRFLAAHGTHAGNAGVWGGSRGSFPADEIMELAEAARPIAGEFVCPDQGFLNFCLDRTATPVRNLHEFIDVPLLWAGVPGYVQSAGSLRDRLGTPVGLVHWAGYKLNRELPYGALWNFWATSGGEAV